MFLLDLCFRAGLADASCFVLLDLVHNMAMAIIVNILTFAVFNSFAGEQLTKGNQAHEGKFGQDRGTIPKCTASTVDIFGGG